MSGIVVGITTKKQSHQVPTPAWRAEPEHTYLFKGSVYETQQKGRQVQHGWKKSKGSTAQGGLGKHALHSAKKRSLQRGTDQSGTTSLSYIP